MYLDAMEDWLKRIYPKVVYTKQIVDKLEKTISDETKNVNVCARREERKRNGLDRITTTRFKRLGLRKNGSTGSVGSKTHIKLDGMTTTRS